jgi:hypothetical protein
VLRCLLFGEKIVLEFLKVGNPVVKLGGLHLHHRADFVHVGRNGGGSSTGRGRVIGRCVRGLRWAFVPSIGVIESCMVVHAVVSTEVVVGIGHNGSDVIDGWDNGRKATWVGKVGKAVARSMARKISVRLSSRSFLQMDWCAAVVKTSHLPREGVAGVRSTRRT